MDIEFATEELDRIEVEGRYSAGLNQGLVKVYRSRINIIRQAIDERTFYAFKSLHFEKLEGKRKGQYSMRLNDQYRLILELIERNSKSKIVRVIEVVDYH